MSRSSWCLAWLLLFTAATLVSGCSRNGPLDSAAAITPSSSTPEPASSNWAPPSSTSVSTSSSDGMGVADFQGWISGSRALLDEHAATDTGMLFVGVTLCQQIPMSAEAAAAIEAGSSRSGVVITADEVTRLVSLAESTLCPGGVMLADPTASTAASPQAVPRARCHHERIAR